MPFIAPILAFFGTLISRVYSMFIAAWLTGAIKSLAIFSALALALVTGISTLINYANQLLLDAIQGASPITQIALGPIASMLPPDLRYCASLIISVWLAGIGYNLAKEIAKLKARWAAYAAGFFKA